MKKRNQESYSNRVTKYRRVVYFVRNEIQFFPPIVSQISYLREAGVAVSVCCGECSEQMKDYLKRIGVSVLLLGFDYSLEGKIGIIRRYINFRKCALKIIDRHAKDTLYWFGTGDVAMSLYGKTEKISFVMNILELYDDHTLINHILKRISRRARAIIVCEKNRRIITQQRWNLSCKSYVMPNKPYTHPRMRSIVPTTDITKAMVARIAGLKFIIYMGLIDYDRDVTNVAKALSVSDTGYSCE